MLFRKRLTPQARALKWLDSLDKGEREGVVQEIARYPRAVTESNVPLLHVAILANHVEVARALLQQGANPNHTDQFGQPPILLAAERDFGAPFITLLHRKGANVNVADRHGASPLMYAVRSNQPEIVKILLEAGADVNHRDNEGDTVLIYALTSENAEIISNLLAAGAAPDQQNFDGLSAIDKCSEGPIKKLLQNQ